MDNAFICERSSCLPEDLLLTLSPTLWLKQRQALLDHLSDFSHLHCCIPKVLSHHPRGLRKLICHLANTPAHTSIPFLKTLLDLLYSLNPDGTWLVAVGMDYLVIQANVFTLLSCWLQERTDIKEWLLRLSSIKSKGLRQREHRTSFESWYCLPPEKKVQPLSHLKSPILERLTVKEGAYTNENQETKQDEKLPSIPSLSLTPSKSSVTERIVMISFDSATNPFQYRKI